MWPRAVAREILDGDPTKVHETKQRVVHHVGQVLWTRCGDGRSGRDRSGRRRSRGRGDPGGKEEGGGTKFFFF